ncbi:MAG: response regulator transcription factor [Clostridia bacterium]|nr:response regulator transcription factor [Clostridia bacterium]
MRIAICDDEVISREQLHKRITAYFLEKNMNCSISEFSSGEAFVPFNSQFDLVFMDCRLEDGNGIDFIEKIRQHNAKLFVIFFTNYSEYAIDSIKLDTFRYLLKPVTDEDFKEALDAFVSIYEHTRKIIVPTRDRLFYLEADEVIYIEADKKYTVIRTTTEQYRSSKPISRFVQEINNFHFFQTHRSYILNMKYVSSIDKRTIILANGEKVLCSSQKYDEFLKNYMSYLKYEF